MDLTYRTDLRELVDLQYSRFDAKLEQRVTELRQEMGERFARLEGELAAGLAGQRADLIKWMFLFWLGSVTAVFIARAL